jgi:hypothetical protein
MAKLVASTFISQGALWLYLNNEPIIKNCDSVSLELQEGKEYIIHWFVSGQEGSPYSVTISSPKEAQFQLTKVLRKSGTDIDSIRFAV